MSAVLYMTLCTPATKSLWGQFGDRLLCHYSGWQPNYYCLTDTILLVLLFLMPQPIVLIACNLQLIWSDHTQLVATHHSLTLDGSLGSKRGSECRLTEPLPMAMTSIPDGWLEGDGRTLRRIADSDWLKRNTTIQTHLWTLPGGRKKQRSSTAKLQLSSGEISYRNGFRDWDGDGGGLTSKKRLTPQRGDSEARMTLTGVKRLTIRSTSVRSRMSRATHYQLCWQLPSL